MIPDPHQNEGANRELPATVDAAHSKARQNGPDSWQDYLQPSEISSHLGKLGDFQITEFVGRGGMGVVFLGWDPKLKRPVAIKIMSPALAQDTLAAKRFLHEAQAAAAIGDEHVVAVFSVHDESDPPFIVMEYVDGISLHDLIAENGPLDLERIIWIGKKISLGLAAAHEKGVVHRDIKPANVLLEAGKSVKVTDFGLARSAEDAGLTQTGHIIGTPNYMSPEQAQGHQVDHRSDIFSLGSLMYAMCAG